MRKLLIILLLGTAPLVIQLAAQEQFTLTTPIPRGQADLTDYRVEKLTLLWKGGVAEDVYEVEVIMRAADGTEDRLRCAYDGAVARADIVTLNTANLSSNSLKKRIMNRLDDVGGGVDGLLPCTPAGTVTGTPDV